MVVFERFKPPDYTDSQFLALQEEIKRVLLGIHISRTGGDVLYSFNVDPTLKIDLISQFMAALSTFGEEIVGTIRRMVIEGLQIEVIIYPKKNLFMSAFFHSNITQDYLSLETEKILDKFIDMFKESLNSGRSNQAIYEKFDHNMYHFVQEFLDRIS